MSHHSALQQKDGLKGTVLHLEGNAQLSPSTDVLCAQRKAWTELTENSQRRLVSYQKPKREIRPPLIPGVHYPVSGKKPVCNFYLHRGVVQKRELIFTQEHKAPDPCANVIQLTLWQPNHHPAEAHPVQIQSHLHW